MMVRERCADVGHSLFILLLLDRLLLAVCLYNGMAVREFQNFSSLQEVECSGSKLPSKVDFLSFVLYRVSDHSVLATLKTPENTCTTFAEFSSCSFGQNDRRLSIVRSLVVDLEEGETTVIGCNVTSFYKKGHPGVYSWSVFVHRRKTTTTSTTTTTTTSTTTTTTTTPRPVAVDPKGGYDVGPVMSGVADDPAVKRGWSTLLDLDFHVSPVVLIIGVCIIVFLALLCVVLIVLQCRGVVRRGKRSSHRGPNRESLLSNKSEQAGGGCSNSSKDLDLGVTTYRSTRSFPVFNSAPTPPPAPPSQVSRGSSSGGGGSSGAMRPQRPPPDNPTSAGESWTSMADIMKTEKGITRYDTGYVSGSSTHYSEPYGCSSPEGTQDRPRSNRGGIPPSKGGSQPPRLPDNHP